jgi:hypothetical protein
MLTVGLERGPLSLVSINEELLERKLERKLGLTTVGDRHADYAKLLPTFADRGMSRGERNATPWPLNSIF